MKNCSNCKNCGEPGSALKCWSNDAARRWLEAHTKVVDGKLVLDPLADDCPGWGDPIKPVKKSI